jgi:hypothetical protein
MAERRVDEQAEPDFAGEHTRPTVADEPGPDAPDESVPTGQAGDGGMDLRDSLGRWWRTLFRRG